MSRARVALVTLGCARNEVDSDELAARLAEGGYDLVGAEDADAVLVNTCGFVEAAKQDSVDTLLAAAGTGAKVVAVGCLAERYGARLAESLPEATVLGFDDYAGIAERVGDVLAGRPHEAHEPRDRRTLLPVLQPAPPRRRLDRGVAAPLKIANGCDRRCSFCAIPMFRGAFVSRKPDDLLTEARQLADDGVRELHLVSENSTSYGKDLGDIRLLEKLLPELASIENVVRVRIAYLQPAEMRPSLVEAIAATPGVADYYDLSFQHASGPLLKRMRRFGDTERFLDLIATIRAHAPEAGVRSNVIVGFPGETRADHAELERFLRAARLDAVGVFAYSDEDGTEAASLPGKVRRDTVERRRATLSTLVETLMGERAEERVGSVVEVLVESVEDGVAEGRAAHQAPEDGSVTLPAGTLRAGDLVPVEVTEAHGVDLIGRSL